MSAELFDAIRAAVNAAQRATNTEERERIAELERDLNAALAVTRLKREDLRILDFIYERMINVHGEKESVDYMLALSRVCRAGWCAASESVGDMPTTAAEVAPLPVEEQGPWVVHGTFPGAGAQWLGEIDEEDGNDWRRNLADVIPFRTKAAAVNYVDTFINKDISEHFVVITLAEARALVASKTVTP